MGSKPSCDNPDSAKRQGTIRLLQDESAFSDLLSHSMPLEEDPLDRLFNSTENRLASMLLVLGNLGQEGQAQPVIPKISQGTLAEIIDTTPSRVNFFMNKFRKLALIAYAHASHHYRWNVITSSPASRRPSALPSRKSQALRFMSSRRRMVGRPKRATTTTRTTISQASTFPVKTLCVGRAAFP
jgi:hypothetical protein